MKACVSALCTGFLIGVAIGSLFSVVLVCFICLAALIGVWLWGRVGAFVWCGFFLGAVAVIARLHDPTGIGLAGSHYSGEGVVTSVVRKTTTQTLAIALKKENISVQVVNFRNFSSAIPGDVVRVNGELSAPRSFDNFDYPAYLRSKGILYDLKKHQLVVIRRGSGIRRWVYSFGERLLQRMVKVYRQPTLGLVAGMLLGEKGLLPQSVVDSFKRAGLSHVLVVSGYNMTLVVSACAIFAIFIGRKATNVLALFAVVLFALLVGMDAPVLRAGIMALVMVTAQLFGRRYSSMYALLMAVTIMVAINPLILIWDVGFQLSALATCGVMVAGKLVTKNSENKWLNYSAPTLGAILFTAPLLSFQFGTMSLVALPANLLAAPLVPLIMFCGLLGTVPFLGKFLSKVTTFLAEIFVGLASFSANQQFSTISARLSSVFMALVYMALVVAVIWWSRKNYSVARTQTK